MPLSETLNQASLLPFGFALLLLVILIVSFRSRAVVFCQYLKKMTGIELAPREVRQVYAARGAEGVRDLFLDLIIKEDLKTGTLQIPGGDGSATAAEAATSAEASRPSGAEPGTPAAGGRDGATPGEAGAS